MLADAIKTEQFAIMFSAILGFSIMALLIPVCKGDECVIQKAPSMSEMKKSTYRIGKKCYQFKPEPVECPAKGAIESFRIK